MMNRQLLLLTALLVVLLGVCFSTFCAFSELEVTWGMIARNFLYNAPSFLLLTLSDYAILYRLNPRKSPAGPSVKSIMTAMLCTPLVLAPFGCLLSAWLGLPYTFSRNILPTVLCNAIIVLLMSIYLYGRQQMENRQRFTLMEQEKLRWQFEALKNQINPHFLFNSLNALASLAYRDADQTSLFAKRLAGVYRYLLTTHDRATVTVEDELQFAKTFIYLEHIRFGEALRVTVAYDGRQAQREVIPTSLQMLVENAVKHNICTPDSPLIVRVSIGEQGVKVSNNLQLRDYAACHNIGLKNLRRLYRLHGKDILTTQTATDFTVEIPYIDRNKPRV